MTLPANLARTLDSVRAVPGTLGLRPFTVTVKVRTWTGSQLDNNTFTDVDTLLTVGGTEDEDGYLVGGVAPHVRQLTQRDAIASGGLYSTQDLEVTLTPAFTTATAAGGFAVSVFDPPTAAKRQEILFMVTGPGLPAGGATYKKIGQRVDSTLTYRITLQKVGV